MTDLEKAIGSLKTHSICLCRGNEIITDDARGIAPMMHLISIGTDLVGFSVADIIVGRAAAMLFLKAGIAAVYGRVTSLGAKTLLESHGVPCRFETLTEQIINREGTDVCPMEKAVRGIDDPDAAYEALCERIKQMKNSKTGASD